MRVLFCKVSYMRYYKGHQGDIVLNGGKYVDKYGYGHEEYNFMATVGDDGEKCLGFVETKATRNDKRNQMHIEKLEGCEACKDEPFVDGVLVVWCATRYPNSTVVVGWYKNATVFRDYQDWNLIRENGKPEGRIFNVEADKEDCVLLPEPQRNKGYFTAPVAKKRGFGFGQSMVYYPDKNNKEAMTFVNELVTNINNYSEENWIDKFPEQE